MLATAPAAARAIESRQKNPLLAVSHARCRVQVSAMVKKKRETMLAMIVQGWNDDPDCCNEEDTKYDDTVYIMMQTAVTMRTQSMTIQYA